MPSMMNISLCINNYTIVMIQGNSVEVGKGLGERVREMARPMELCHKIVVIIKRRRRKWS